MKKILIFFIAIVSAIFLTGCYGLDRPFISDDYYDKLLNIPTFSFNITSDNYLTGSITTKTRTISHKYSPIETRYFDLTDYENIVNKIFYSDNLTKTEKDQLLSVYAFFEGLYQEKDINDMTGRYAGYNLINIMGESFDSRFVSEFLTPNIYKLMQESINFDNYYANEFHQGATCNSEFMSITGLFPVGAPSWNACMCDEISENGNIFPFSLPSQLENNGYDTYYFHSYVELFYNRNTIVPQYGFSRNAFIDTLYHQYGIRSNYYYDSNMLNFFTYFIDADEYKNTGKNFYVNVLTYSQHGDYNDHNIEDSSYPYTFKWTGTLENADIVRGILDEMYGVEKSALISSEMFKYLQRQYEFDNFIGELINWLKENGLYDNTILNIYRDHHPYMFSSDAIFNDYLKDYVGLEESEYTGINVYKQTMIMHIGGSNDKHIDSTPMSTIDLVPTLLNMLGVKANYKYLAGHDIYDGDNLVFINPTTYINENEYLVTDGKKILSISNNEGGHNLTDEEYEHFLKYFQEFYTKIYYSDKILKYNFFNYFVNDTTKNE